MPAPPHPATIAPLGGTALHQEELTIGEGQEKHGRFQTRKNQPCFAGHSRPWVVVSDPESPFAAESTRPVPAIQAGPLRGVMFAQPRVARAVVMSCYASFSHARSFQNGTRLRSLLRNQRRLSSSTSRQSCTPGRSWQPDVPLSCERTSHT